ASDRFLLCEERRGDEESAEQHYEQSCSHDGRLPVFGVKSRSYGEDSDCQELRSPEARREPREHRGLVTTRSRNSTMLQRAIRTVSSGSPPPLSCPLTTSHHADHLCNNCNLSPQPHLDLNTSVSSGLPSVQLPLFGPHH